jgi:hypothetical protein
VEDIDFRMDFVARNSKKFKIWVGREKSIEATFTINTCATLVFIDK